MICERCHRDTRVPSYVRQHVNTAFSCQWCGTAYRVSHGVTTVNARVLLAADDPRGELSPWFDARLLPTTVGAYESDEPGRVGVWSGGAWESGAPVSKWRGRWV